MKRARKRFTSSSSTSPAAFAKVDKSFPEPSPDTGTRDSFGVLCFHYTFEESSAVSNCEKRMCVIKEEKKRNNETVLIRSLGVRCREGHLQRFIAHGSSSRQVQSIGMFKLVLLVVACTAGALAYPPSYRSGYRDAYSYGYDYRSPYSYSYSSYDLNPTSSYYGYGAYGSYRSPYYDNSYGLDYDYDYSNNGYGYGSYGRGYGLHNNYGYRSSYYDYPYYLKK